MVLLRVLLLHLCWSSRLNVICVKGYLKYLSVSVKFIIYCKSCGQQHNDRVKILTLKTVFTVLPHVDSQWLTSWIKNNHYIAVSQIIYTGMSWLRKLTAATFWNKSKINHPRHYIELRTLAVALKTWEYHSVFYVVTCIMPLNILSIPF